MTKWIGAIFLAFVFLLVATYFLFKILLGDRLVMPELALAAMGIVAGYISFNQLRGIMAQRKSQLK